MPARYCSYCGGNLPEGVNSNRKFCSRSCRNKSSRETIARRKRSGQSRQVTKAVADLRKLVKFDETKDPAVIIREVLQDIVRDNITQHVQDNILGLAEAMTALLPKVIAGLAKDLESPDDFIRTRAQAAVLKYTMEFKDKKGTDQDLGVITIQHNMSLPNTPLGHAIHDEIIQIDEDQKQIAAESFEQDWPICTGCGDRKHPDVIRRDRHGELLCSSCKLKQAVSQGRSGDPAFIFTSDPEFGRPDPPPEPDE